jgi:SAM-dependent methyltransferase
MDRVEMLEQYQTLKRQYGAWSYDIPLPYDLWTGGNQNIPHTRLKRIVQIVCDTVNKPLSECRILDLGCLEGLFPIEFAQRGAETIGVDVREASIKKATFCKEALQLNKLEFRLDDARHISKETYGMFDAIICSGLLYHITAPEAIDLISKMYSMTHKLVVIDTHIALKPEKLYKTGDLEYWGKIFHEHDKKDKQDLKSIRNWSSWDNNESFWFTRPSLINLIGKAGFTSVYECFNPAHLNFGKPGIEWNDRCTFVALKGEPCKLTTSPSVNELHESWPEESLSYCAVKSKPSKPFRKKVKSKLEKILKR